MCAASAARVGAHSFVEGAEADCRPAPAVIGVTEGESLAGTVAPSIGTLRAVVLLVHASDSPPDESLSGPQALLDGVSAWFRAVSYGRLELRVETVPRWLALPARSTEYARNAGGYIADAVAPPIRTLTSPTTTSSTSRPPRGRPRRSCSRA